MTVFDGLPFTQLTNLNITGELYEHGEPFGGVTAPLTLSTANNPNVRPLKLRGGATVGEDDYDSINSGLLFTDGSDVEIWRLWASEPIEAQPNGGNLFLGYFAGAEQPTGTANPNAGHHNTGMGYFALGNLTEGDDNTGMGFNALAALVDGDNNTGVGSHALNEVGNGMHNTAVGADALKFITGADFNTAVGSLALTTAGSGAASNTAVGHNAGGAITSGFQNTAVGDQALHTETTGDNNTAIGQFALGKALAGGQNTALGRAALDNLVTGSNNIGIGHSIANNLTSGSGNTFIGHNVVASDPVVSDEMNICNQIIADLNADEIFLPTLPANDDGTPGSLWNDGGVVSIVPDP